MEITMTVGQIAKELGVSRQAVYQKIRLDKQLQADLQQFTVKQGNKTLYTAEGQKRLIEAFSGRENVKRETTTEKKVNSQLVDSLQDTVVLLKDQVETLKVQLEVKDDQIRHLQKHVDELTTALQAAQALHGLEHSPKAIEVETVPADQPGEHPQPERKPERQERQRRTAPERVAPGLPKLSLFQKIKKALK